MREDLPTTPTTGSESAPDATGATGTTPPTFAPTGTTAVLTTPYGQAGGRTSVMDAAHATDPQVHAGAGAGTEEMAPLADDQRPLNGEAADAAAQAGQAATTLSPADDPAAGDAGSEAPTAVAAPALTTVAGDAPDATGQADDWQPADPADASQDEPARRRRWPLWGGIAAAVVLVAAVGSGAAYAAHYSDVATPRSSVGGVSVSGMSHDEIAQLVSQRASKATVTVTGDASATLPLDKLGTTVDAKATADAAMAPSRSVLSRLKALVTGNEVSVVTSTNAEAAQAAAASMVPSDESAPVDATVTLDQAGTAFTTTPAKDGQGIDAAVLSKAATQAASTLAPQKISVSFTTTKPAVSDATATSAADKANAIVATDVTVTGPEDKTFTADAATKASWVVIGADAKSQPTVSVSAEKVAAWLDQQSAQVAKDPVNGVRNVNTKGDVVATTTEAVDGVKVANTADLAEQIIGSLNSAKAFTGAFSTEAVKATWKDRTIADGAENLAYPAAPGEKWVDINLARKTVTAYEGATVVHGPVSVVDGAAATPTVTGTYHVYLKYASQTMRGTNADGSRYETPGVPWVTYFYQGYALHGAPWRSSFGYSGSHGCLNMPVSEAKWFYDWTEMGTTVVAHR